MLKRFALCTVAALSLSLFAPTARAEEKKSEPLKTSPQYTYWAKHKVGATVTLEGKMAQAQGQVMTMTMTSTLVEVGKETVTIERSMSMTVNGQVMNQPTKKEVVQMAPKGGEETREVGEEEVTVAGKTYKCKIFESTREDGGKKTTARVWATDAVPGGAIKMAMKNGPQELNVNLLSFDAK